MPDPRPTICCSRGWAMLGDHVTYVRRAQAAHDPLAGSRSQFHREGERGVIERVVRLDADLTPEQRARFADIIERTPVTLTLKAGSDIRTEFK